MTFKDISYLEFWWPFCSAEWNCLWNFGRGYYEEQLCEVIFNFDQWFRRKCLLKIFIIWSSGSTCEPFVQFGRRYQEEQICDIIFNLGQWLRDRYLLKIFHIWNSGSPFVQQSGSFCAILVEGIMRNNSVNLFQSWTSCSSGDVV